MDFFKTEGRDLWIIPAAGKLERFGSACQVDVGPLERELSDCAMKAGQLLDNNLRTFGKDLCNVKPMKETFPHWHRPLCTGHSWRYMIFENCHVIFFDNKGQHT